MSVRMRPKPQNKLSLPGGYTIYTLKLIDSPYILCYYTDIVLFYAFPDAGSCFGILRNPVHEQKSRSFSGISCLCL